MEKINIKTKNKEYDVIINNDIIVNINDYIKDDNTKKFVIYDSNLPSFFMEKLFKLNNSFFYSFKATETNKNFKQVEKIVEKMIELNINRDDKVVCIGGGITIDVGAFVASIYKRGIEYISLPTTLLAMVDVCIGGKTGINSIDYKNMMGTFYQPSLVLIDHTFLGTLDDENIICGLLEAFKMGIVKDPTLIELIHQFVENQEEDPIDDIIKKSLEVKKYYIEQDEYDTGIRNVLNFGHTFGHALERASRFKYKHGIAVGIGMLYESKGKVKDIIFDMLIELGINVDVYKYLDDIFDYMMKDKKMHEKSISQIKVEEVGKAYIDNVSIEEYVKWFAD